MDLFNEFAVDTDRLQGGVWRVFDTLSDRIVEEAEIGEEPAILLSSTDNPKYQQILEQKMKPHIMKRGMEVDRKVKERMIAETLAETVILNWRNWTVKGQQMEYSKANVIELWTNPMWARLKERVLAMIGDVDAFKAAREETIVGN